MEHSSGPIETRKLLAYKILSLSSLLSRGIETILESEVSLSIRQWRVLLYVANHGPDTVQRIAAFWRYDKSQVSRAVSELTERRFVTTRIADGDRRSVIVAPTRSGMNIYRQALPLSLKRQRELASCLRTDQLEDLEVALDVLTSKAEMMLIDAQEVKANRKAGSR